MDLESPLAYANESVPSASANPASTLFVLNLPKGDSREVLESTFGASSGFKDVTVPKNGQAKGYAFVRFHDAETATAALERMQGYAIGGRPIAIQFSRNDVEVRDQPYNLPDGASVADDIVESAANRLVLKNLPFEANRRDLLDIVRCVRINLQPTASCIFLKLHNWTASMGPCEAFVCPRRPAIHCAGLLSFNTLPASRHRRQ